MTQGDLLEDVAISIITNMDRVDDIFVTMMAEKKNAATAGPATTAAAVRTAPSRLLTLMKDVKTAVPVVDIRDEVR